MTHAAKVCPTCRRTYPVTQNFCEADGQRLVAQSNGSASDQVPAPAKPPAAAKSSPVVSQRGFRWPKETLAGIVVVVLLGLSVVGMFGYRQSKKLSLTITFEEAHGLKTGDSVYIQGADVGEVTRAEFRDGRFAADIIVNEHAVHQFRHDTEFFVGYDKLLVNKKCIVAYVRDPKIKSPPLESGKTVPGKDSLLEYYLTLIRQNGPADAMKIYGQLKSMIWEQSGGPGK